MVRRKPAHGNDLNVAQQSIELGWPVIAIHNNLDVGRHQSEAVFQSRKAQDVFTIDYLGDAFPYRQHHIGMHRC